MKRRCRITGEFDAFGKVCMQTQHLKEITKADENMLITVGSFVMRHQENTKNWLARASEKPTSIICFNFARVENHRVHINEACGNMQYTELWLIFHKKNKLRIEFWTMSQMLSARRRAQLFTVTNTHTDYLKNPGQLSIAPVPKDPYLFLISMVTKHAHSTHMYMQKLFGFMKFYALIVDLGACVIGVLFRN
ncbi:hypothetical protein STEG23_028278 [Scotinomys teguina]